MYFNYDDINIYYEKYGSSNKSIIILPGWGETRKTFLQMIHFLKDYFTVYIVDYPGFGNSIFPNYDLTIYDYSRIIYEWIDSLNINDPILIGHSFGGRIITVLTGYYHYNFSNIILMNSAGIKPKKTLYSKLKTLSYKLLKRIAKLLPKNIRNKFTRYLFNHFASSDYKAIDKKIMPTFRNIISEDLKPYLKNIKSRVLLIWGDLDTATPIKDAYIMQKEIKNSELIVVEGTDHFTYLRRPFLINSIIYEQLKNEI